MAHKTDYNHDPIEMLKEDHRKVKELFKEYREFGDGAIGQKEAIARKIFAELELHTKIEEEIFYPAIEASEEGEAQKMVTESYIEHNMVKSLISELRELGASNVEFEARMKVLMEHVEHHVEEEESELFPLAKKELSEELDMIGTEMEEMKRQVSAAS